MPKSDLARRQWRITHEGARWAYELGKQHLYFKVTAHTKVPLFRADSPHYKFWRAGLVGAEFRWEG